MICRFRILSIRDKDSVSNNLSSKNQPNQPDLIMTSASNMETRHKKIKNTKELQTVYSPVFFRLAQEQDARAFEALLDSDAVSFIHDELEEQLKELIKCKHPSRQPGSGDMEQLILQHLNGIAADQYGVWVYYPWNKTMVHLLGEEEFIQVRTNRNQLKITREEQEQLRQKKIGIIGLSVGQSIALTLATERACGTLYLADFDALELSNLNRIRAGVKSLGLSKVIIAAREIAEMDPFIHVEIFPEGLRTETIDGFLNKNGKLDILVEVCDNMDMKIQCRLKAKAMHIPVVMDTNDRGMLDIERFDLQPERPLLHGLLDGIPTDNMATLNPEQRMAVILKIVGADSISTRLKQSIAALNQSIHALPQLASSVVLGGAITTDVCRRILLGELTASGRFYVDTEDIISGE